MSNSLLTLRGRDFISVSDFDRSELLAVLDVAAEMKAGAHGGRTLLGREIALLFQKPSMRTRVSFEVGISRLGGHSVTLGEQDVQLGTRETLSDAGRVLDRYVDCIIGRFRRHDELLQLAQWATIPVVNALTDREHPCQVLADLMTIREHRGSLDGRIAFVGDGNNMVVSLAAASARLGFELTVVTPPGHRPPADAVVSAPRVVVTGDLAAVDGAAIVYTDVWASMGWEAEREVRSREFAEYQVDAALMARSPEALFMHCLPAHRGEEVTDEVIESERSIVFDQAENRLWAQMALLALILG